MSFSDLQLKQLKAKLDHARVKSRDQDGRPVSYVEGWYVIAEANRIFGFEGWDRITLPHQLLFERKGAGGMTDCAYLARVRIIVRADAHVVVREGSGFGAASRLDPGEAHDIALKTAETDATKRALATFGNRFGLALYDKEQVGVGKPKPKAEPKPAQQPMPANAIAASPIHGLIESRSVGEANSASTDTAVLVTQEAPSVTSHQLTAPPSAGATSNAALQSALIFLKAMRERVTGAASLDELETCLTSAKPELDRLRAAYPDLRNRRGIHFSDVVTSIADLRRLDLRRGTAGPKPLRAQPLRLSIDKSQLALATAKRHRDRDHLRRVAARPCLICGRTPAQAHHLRFAQDRGMALKVSDEFTVPLCRLHHDELHRAVDEQRWWQERHIDPLLHAQELWAASRHGSHRFGPPPAPSEAPLPGDDVQRVEPQSPNANSQMIAPPPSTSDPTSDGKS